MKGLGVGRENRLVVYHLGKGFQMILNLIIMLSNLKKDFENSYNLLEINEKNIRNQNK